ncbi:uncharacterized protein LOC119667454 [Teleopsis dalmanni]|uniref:uncharacterized protein LOC119667454 n=1 Tax=Teleopsis dalmanni TaxID=139649 RepID=UPI0018CE5CD2|nr:uncharacterized protein LOC119667454 [Teleopsis dalmanni]
MSAANVATVPGTGSVPSNKEGAPAAIPAPIRKGIVKQQSGDKDSRVCKTLARLMPNIGGPKDTARVLLASVSKSVMLYAAPVWTHATTIKSYSRVMKSAHRLANLRICRAYRTVSDDAAGVLAGRMSIDLEALLAKDSFFLRSRLRMNETQQSLSHTYLEIKDKYLNEW